MATSTNIIAGKDVEVQLTLDELGVPYTLKTAVSVNPEVNGTTDPIHRLGSSEPLNPGQGDTNHTVALSLQASEWNTLLDAYAAKMVELGRDPIVHVRDIIGNLTLSVIEYKRRDVPAVMHVTTWYGCTGVSESAPKERSATETVTELNFQCRGKGRVTVPIA